MGRRLVVAVVAAVATVLVTPLPAAAAGVGYVRLAHLSPDTPEVDVYLKPLASGGGKEQVFPGVGYGVVSPYLSLPAGAYLVAMRLAGAAPSTPAVISTQVTVEAGMAYTVAGTGPNKSLGLTILDDDLSMPASGKAKVRIIQASVKSPVLNVSVSGGETIAAGVAFATNTDYREVGAGQWTVQLQPGGGSTNATDIECSLTEGYVYSLIVLDKAEGGLTAELRTDAQRNGVIPQGGVETGVQDDTTAPLLWAGTGAVVLAGVGLLALSAARRRRRVWR